MALPKIDLPIYDLKIPSTGKEIQIRPFKVKEEKLLLIAAETADPDEIINSTKQVVNNCIVTEGVDIDKLTYFDIDYIFIALRSKSVGDKVEMKYTCNAVVEDKPCGASFDAEIDISNVEIVKNDSTLKLNLGNIIMKMRYPNYTTMKSISDKDSAIDKKIKILAACIDVVTQGDKVYTRKDFSEKEMIDFIENLTEQQYRTLEIFVDELPFFIVKIEKKCPKCGFEHVMEYNDLTDFFQ
jgi:hypothetical protein